MITPFTSDKKLYEDGARNLIEFLREHGVNGLFICGTYGLGPAMTIEERKKLAELTMRYVPENMYVIVQVGSSNIDTSLELAKHAEDVGAQAVASTPLFYYKYRDDYVLSYFRKLFSAVDIPVFVYNVPSRVGYGISPSLLGKLAEEGAQGVKDTSGDIITFYQFMMNVKKRDFIFLVGTERLLVPSVVAGGHGCVAGLSNTFPEHVVELYKLTKEGRMKEAVQKQFFIIELRNTLYSVPHIPAAYAVLKMRGIDVGYPKEPYRLLSEEETEKLKRMLEEKGLL